ncbi:MAG TPA: D-alanine--D-alanine ligase [Nitrospiria bacterium]|nr:D-alanine--D-alanine ligase [Nitrospiria bacterium]
MITSKKIGVLMGGNSAEAEVSLKTGKAILQALKKTGYHADEVLMSRSVARTLEEKQIEIVFNGLHGKGGEDGNIQGFLETLGIPYTGSGVLASALGMDKVASRKVFLYHGLPVPEFHLVTSAGRSGFRQEAVSFQLPWVIKPSREGSSVGVSIVEAEKEISPALADALTFDGEAIIEPYIKGREVQVGILEEEALGIIEIRTKRKFYDYTAKYVPGMSEHLYPAPLSEPLYRNLMALGLSAHRALGCRGYSRVDFLLDAGESPWLLEVNTLPGMTETSLLPEIARGSGISFERLVERILAVALKK